MELLDVETNSLKSNLFDIVIGLEIHAQIKSKSKLFSRASTEFESDYNENVSVIDAALPGSLPLAVNVCAIEAAIKTGSALNAKINSISLFDRKHYNYPDLPKGYQISQYYYPIVQNGILEIPILNDYKSFRINRIHLEEDAGQSIHDLSLDKTLINLNRAGIGLMEIVTEPDFSNHYEVVEFLKHLRLILLYLDVCDCNMEEGSFRIDVNLSLKEKNSSQFGTRVELKNINSFKFIKQAILFETSRQEELLLSGKKVKQETRSFDQSIGETKLMREKETATDYRYFQDPDILPVVLEQEYINSISKSLPKMPQERLKTYRAKYDLSLKEAEIIVSDREVCDFFDDGVKILEFDLSKVKLFFNWLVVEVFSLLSSQKISLLKSNIVAKNLTDLVILIYEKKISGKIAKEVLLIMFETGQNPNIIVKENNLEMISCEKEISSIIAKVLEDNKDKVLEYLNGKDKLFGFFVGQVMKISDGKLDPEISNRILKEMLDKNHALDKAK